MASAAPDPRRIAIATTGIAISAMVIGATARSSIPSAEKSAIAQNGHFGIASARSAKSEGTAAFLAGETEVMDMDGPWKEGPRDGESLPRAANKNAARAPFPRR